MGLLERPAGWTSSLYLKSWPIRLFEDLPFSLYVFAASESDKAIFYSEKNSGWLKGNYLHINSMSFS